MPRLVKIRNKTTNTIVNFYEKMDKVLIFRNAGGLGDILMHRMIFEDLKACDPNMKIVFACPYIYAQAVQDHPYIDEILDSNNVRMSDYNIAYNTTNCCSRHEMSIAPYSDKHRSDIWANHCGIELKHHNMHIHLTPQEIEYGINQIKHLNKDNKKSVLLCPVSAMPSKNLLGHQIAGVVDYLRKNDYFVFCLHNTPLKFMEEINVPMISGQNIRQWMGLISATDYVISVDTSAFHFAGGIGKPVVGIFTWADGSVYGRYYPTMELVQFHRDTHPDHQCGPCYGWLDCPLAKGPFKPCLTKITPEMITKGFENLINRSCHK